MRKLVCLILAAFMAIGMLSGCKNEGTISGKGGKTSASTYNV